MILRPVLQVITQWLHIKGFSVVIDKLK